MVVLCSSIYQLNILLLLQFFYVKIEGKGNEHIYLPASATQPYHTS